jgi:uncharacterized protein YjbI with pentapeptide repeats
MSNFSKWLEKRYLRWQVETGSRATLVAFARFIGISRVSLSQYMHGSRIPNEAHLAKMATQLGAEVYAVLEKNDVEVDENKKRPIGKLLKIYWPVGFLVIVGVALIFGFSAGIRVFLNSFDQTGNTIPGNLETASAGELTGALFPTVEAASIQAKATALAIQGLEKGDCNTLEPGANLRLCDLSGRDLSRINLSGANMQGVNLNNAKLPGADLSGADLTGASLISTNLTGVNLSGALLVGANLSDSNLSKASLVNADLTGAIMRGADLTWVNFSGATLLGADLSDCNLLNSQMDITQLSETLSIENALLPLNLR